MYLIRFLLNFAARILRVFVNFAALRPREISEAQTMSCIIYKLATKHLHLATIFLQLAAKRRPEDFFNFEPCLVMNGSWLTGGCFGFIFLGYADSTSLRSGSRLTAKIGL